MTDHDEQPRRKRARLACTACNARRVKCNVTESQPCHNCIAGNVVCETRESRRGKHPRRSKILEVPGGSRLLDSATKFGPETHSPSNVGSTPRRHEDEVAASHVLASLSATFQGGTEIERTSPEDLGNSSAKEFPSAFSTSEPEAARTPRAEDDEAVFLGESSSLRYVTDEQMPTTPAPKRPRLRHSVPNAVTADALVPQWEADRRRVRMKSLQNDGTFTFPPSPVRVGLLKAYFRWFHPHFAIVDESEFWKTHDEGTVSPLLLQAMLFIGVIHCEESIVHSLDWGSRDRAKWLFYTRAKDIYDFEYETRKVTVIQTLFLLSFWRAGALLEKDARHWLGTAITLAQTKALHRSTGGDMNVHPARLKRRLWWAIYVRERQCGSALGLPNRIRDKDCDVEKLSPSDFNSAFDPSTPNYLFDQYTAYNIGVTQLAILLGKIVDAGYLPNRNLKATDRANIRDEIYRWRQQLPSAMQLSSDSGEPPSFQASMLHLAYNNLLILLYRSSFISNEESNGEVDGNIALQAAARNSRIVEDMLPSGNIGHAQIHVITNLFNTLCIHVVHLRRSSGINRTIAEHRAKLCLLGLQELQRTWEVTNWMLQVFGQYLDRSTAARLAMEADDVGVSNTASRVASSGNHATAPTNGNTTVSMDVMDNSRPPANQGAPPTADNEPTMTPWSWTTDEANQYLFSQIENDFAFGEGGMLEWSPGTLANGLLPDFGFGGLGTLG